MKTNSKINNDLQNTRQEAKDGATWSPLTFPYHKIIWQITMYVQLFLAGK